MVLRKGCGGDHWLEHHVVLVKKTLQGSAQGSTPLQGAEVLCETLGDQPQVHGHGAVVGRIELPGQGFELRKVGAARVGLRGQKDQVGVVHLLRIELGSRIEIRLASS